ncbi:MAG: serine/threonine-protein kinase [Candidatus Acidiferrales bacterium]
MCPACAAPLHPELDDDATIASSGASASSAEEGRFPAGIVLAGRYRILGLIGRGGMGEVYRAYDLILNQAVALKFLGPANISEDALVRFRNEVRVARQVSHPNVCRVYDIGFIEGSHFLSMEYLDGEDLSSLIRRIGRLPQDKAIEFARKICAGLAAAHERGVLHRDLKPANIMIDGRGQVRITDFGLAALAQEVGLGDIRSGTPAYMAPEQRAGKEVTTRSDIYSLGLTLYEMFTGKRRADTQTNPTDVVRDLDPTVDRLIVRCLEEDPKRRPSSALTVAMALPGGDPIAAALAAGETPSPEMVAASGEKEGFTRRTAILCFAGIIVAIAASFIFLPLIRGSAPLLRRIPSDIPPEVLAFRAQDMLKQFGYAEKHQSTAYGFDCCDGPNLRFVEQFDAKRRDELLASGQPPMMGFWYRQAAGELMTTEVGSGDEVSYDSPPNSEPQMIRMTLDTTGRLIALEARPAETSSDSKSAAFDWTVLFKDAGLDYARFTPTTPSFTPPMAFDSRMAWVGTYGDGRPEQIRVEAATWQGRPVYFDVSGTWRKLNESSEYRPRVVNLVFASLFLFLLIGAALVARYNLHAGRGDRKGALTIAVVAFLSGACSWALTATHVASIDEIGVLAGGISLVAFVSGVLWLAYIAIEPYARRHWPDSLISWNRLLAGRIRDPLVASHILAGVFLFFAAVVMTGLASVLVSAAPVAPPAQMMASLTGATDFAAGLIGNVQGTLITGSGFLLLVVLLRLVFRRIWIADSLSALVWVALGLAVDFTNPVRFAVTGAAYVLAGFSILWVIRRFGFLSIFAFWFVNNIFILTPPLQPTAWYGARSLVGFGVLIALPAWALWVVLSAQKPSQLESRA